MFTPKQVKRISSGPSLTNHSLPPEKFDELMDKNEEKKNQSVVMFKKNKKLHL